jgi:alcohol dehydrogenase (cytochrome c)
MLEKPDADDWLHWRRTLNNWGFSPLTQINKQNVAQLKLAWSHPVVPGVQGGMLVHDGVMFVPAPPGIVQALDATTGTLLWEYKKTFEASPNYSWVARTRSLAIYDDKIYVGTPDAHLVALNARTGAVVWDHTVADYKIGYRYTSGPIALKGKIVAGMTGCERFKDGTCFISGHDADTGKELWRVSTIARPGEPGGDTWGDLPLNKRAGGDVWIPGSYDPATNLMYWSTANPKPWARVSRHTDGDALYTNSVLAINPDSGNVVWYQQIIPGETLDHDEVFENVLIDHDGQSSLFKMGKLAILWELDRKTGHFRSAYDMGYQNVLEVNPQSGKVTYRPAMIPKRDVPFTMCPGQGGIRNWQPTAYDPTTQMIYVTVRPSCEKVKYSEVKQENVGDFHYYGNPEYNGVTHLGITPHPASPNDRGLIIAMSIKSGAIEWKDGRPVNASSGVLAAGGMVAAGFGNGTLAFDDARTGKTLFEESTPGGPIQGAPISYAARGKQYVAYAIGGTTNAIRVLTLP